MLPLLDSCSRVQRTIEIAESSKPFVKPYESADPSALLVSNAVEVAKYGIVNAIGINIRTNRGLYKASVSFRTAELNAQQIDIGDVSKLPRLD